MGSDLLQEILQPGPPFLKEARLETFQHALWRQRRHCRLKAGKGLNQPSAKIVELGVALANVHVGALTQRRSMLAVPFPLFLLPFKSQGEEGGGLGRAGEKPYI